MDKGGGETPTHTPPPPLGRGGGVFFSLAPPPPPSHVDGESSAPSQSVAQASLGADEAGAEVAVGTARRGH